MAELLPAQLAVGPCPHCGKIDNWLNDMPLKAFCWGMQDKEHKEWHKTVPAPFNPYLEGYDRDAVASHDLHIIEAATVRRSK
jgi:hypothetical protein